MMELLGLLDTLEATILSGKKSLFSEKVTMPSTKLLEIIDKMRIIMKSGGGTAKRAIENLSIHDPHNEKVILSKVQREALLIKEGANMYADETLAYLKATVLRLERTIENGRRRLEKMREEARNDQKKS